MIESSGSIVVGVSSEYEEFNLEGSYLERRRERENSVTKLVLDI